MINRITTSVFASILLLAGHVNAAVQLPREFANEAHKKLYLEYGKSLDTVAVKFSEDRDRVGAHLETSLSDRLVLLAETSSPERVRELKEISDAWLGTRNQIKGEIPKELKAVVELHNRSVRRTYEARERNLRVEIDRLIRGVDALAKELSAEAEGKEKAAALRAEATALMASRGGQTFGKLVVANFSWRQGDDGFVRMQTVGDELIGLSFLSGTFAGGGEGQDIGRLHGAEGPVGLHAKAMQGDVRSAAIALRDPRLNLGAAKVTFATVSNEDPERKKLIHKSRGFCYLAGISGYIGDLTHFDVTLDPEDGFYYLSGRRQAYGAGRAVIVEYPEGETPEFEQSYVEWRRGDPVRTPLAAEDGICLMTGLQGAFHGAGEYVFARIGGDGKWHVGGRSGMTNTRVRALVLRLKEKPTSE